VQTAHWGTAGNQAERESRRLAKAGAGRASEIEDERKRIVNRLLLHWAQSTGELFEAFDVNRAKLLDQHPGAFSAKLDLGPECRWPRAA